MAARRVPGIFCIEGGWSPKLTDERSVRPLLTFLEEAGRVRFIHRDVENVESLIALLYRWPQHQYAGYTLGYFGFHGSPGYLRLGRERISLEELGEHLRGACRGKTLYFGSCSVLDLPKARITAFLRATKARCVAGHRYDIDWFESAAFDLLLLDALASYRRIDAVERWITEQHRGMVKRLGFRMYY